MSSQTFMSAGNYAASTAISIDDSCRYLQVGSTCAFDKESFFNGHFVVQGPSRNTPCNNSFTRAARKIFGLVSSKNFAAFRVPHYRASGNIIRDGQVDFYSHNVSRVDTDKDDEAPGEESTA